MSDEHEVLADEAAAEAPPAEAAPGLDPDLLQQARDAATGHPGLEDALRRLEELDDVELDQHPEEFDRIHRVLREALTDAGQERFGESAAP
jgi:hypothetical protein